VSPFPISESDWTCSQLRVSSFIHSKPAANLKPAHPKIITKTKENIKGEMKKKKKRKKKKQERKEVNAFAHWPVSLVTYQGYSITQRHPRYYLFNGRR